jgi:hypothetical protein
MKAKNKICTFFAGLILLVACTSQKEAAYELPDVMLPHVKVEYEKRCAKGKILYDLNCAKCHNTKKGRKEIIPDFKPEQLLGYTIRVSNAQHEINMPDSLVTEEELGIIMTFLSYKKKNPVHSAKR